MAKKKNILSGNNRLFLIGGVGAVGAVLVAVFFFGVGIEGTLPFVPANEVIPTQLTTQEIQENEQIIIEITEITEAPTDFCPTAITALMSCISAQDEIIIENSNEETSIFCGLTDEEINQCNNEIDELITELNSQINESPPITNDTDSSPDPIDDQVCDILDLDCGKKPPIQLVTNVIKTDSQGFTSSEESSIDVPQLSFFIEDVVNGTRDFQSGQLEIQIKLIGEPGLEYVGTASMDVRIGNETISQIPLAINGNTNLNGELTIQFLSFCVIGVDSCTVNEGGIASNNFVFLFMPNFDKFLNEQTTTLEFIVNDFIVDFSAETGIQFGIEEASIFSMDIARDDIKLIVTDEGGNIVRVFPSDSRMVLSSVTGRTDTYLTGVIRQTVTQSDFRCNGCGCTQYYVSSDRTFEPTTVNTGIVIAKPVISADLKDSDGIDIISGSGTGTIIDYNTLTRNQNYTLLVSTTGDLSELDYGKVAETKSFQCSQEGTVTTTTSTPPRTGSRCGEPCGTCVTTTSQIFGSVVLGDITCNVP